MKEFLLYLSGPMTGVSYGSCTNWQEYVADQLPAHIIAMSAMRSMKHLALADKEKIENVYADPLNSSKGMTASDRMDVIRCDAMLVNVLGAEYKSTGTIIEIGWADMLRKPIILVMEDAGNVHDHAMIREMAQFIVPNLDAAVKTAITLLTPRI